MAKRKQTAGERIAATITGRSTDVVLVARRIDRAIKKAEGRAWSRGVDFANPGAKTLAELEPKKKRSRK